MALLLTIVTWCMEEMPRLISPLLQYGITDEWSGFYHVTAGNSVTGITGSIN
jgi:hypothetical protein